MTDPKLLIVTSEEWPNIVEAFNTIADDTGNIPMPVYEIPARWKSQLPDLEKTLGALSRTERAPESPPLPPHVRPNEFLDSEFYTFCNGEYTEQNAISNRSLAHARAAVFLNDFFEDWTYTADSGTEVPENKTVQRRIEWLEEIERESGIGLSIEQRLELERLRLELT
jgi:hypothetical protein